MVFALSHGARVEFGGYHSMVVGVYSVICFSMPEVGFLQTSFRVIFSSNTLRGRPAIMSSHGVTSKTELGLPEPSTAPSSPTRLPRRTLRKEATAFIGEFIGTFMFLSLAFAGTQIALNSVGIQDLTPSISQAKPDVSKLLYIAFAFGVSLAINVAIFADLSGGKFNPAVGSARSPSSWLNGHV